jgi:hypothetical protein
MHCRNTAVKEAHAPSTTVLGIAGTPRMRVDLDRAKSIRATWLGGQKMHKEVTAPWGFHSKSRRGVECEPRAR